MIDGDDGTPDAAAILLIDAAIAPKLSFATHQNDVPALRDLRLVNTSEEAVENVVLTVEADPPVFAAREWRFDRIAGGDEVGVGQRDLQLNAGLLLRLTEAVRATVTLRARIGEGEAVERIVPVELLAHNEWGGANAMPELLAAFVLPNDPAIGRVLKAASETLRRAERRESLEGYQSGSRQRVYEIASAVWSAIAALRLTYVEPPASFEVQGQKVRTPSHVVGGGLATCLDTALLFAAALEQIGLFPIVALVQGHAFAGVWLQPQEFATLLVHDAAALRKRIALKELVVFETTLATGSAPVGFARAIADAERRIDEERESEFVAAIDVRRARIQRIRPLAVDRTGDLAETAPAEETEIETASAVLEAAPPLPDFDLIEDRDAPSTAEGRLERWQRKLLDLTTRNRLLHVKPGGSAVRLMCPDPAALEDQLAGGRAFRIVAEADFAGAAGRDVALHAQRTGVALPEHYAAQALARGELPAHGEADRIEAQLVELYRKARLDVAEGGANTLFLAIGFLLWKKDASSSVVYRAPLLLVPVKLERRSVRSGIRMSIGEDEPRFNLTLLQMLRQDFKLDIPELAGPPPTDASGIDVPLVLRLMRRAVRDTAGFEVADDVVLGTFSFAKYLMWKDLVDRTDALKANRVVRHLLETPREPYAHAVAPPRPETLDAETEPATLFAPLSADSSQLAAVVGSARGGDFVLDGPPGTGKSQTIANIIAHNLALGRTVLFVAEKRAALDVVRRRLEANGIGPFCLELHSNKASKQDVLAQLDAAWNVAEELPADEWRRRAEDLKTSRDGLNRLVAALHRRHLNGLSVYEAVGAAVGGGDAVRLDWPIGPTHAADALETMRKTVRQLDLLRPADAVRDALDVVGRTEWSNAWQTGLLAAAARLGSTATFLRDQTRFATALGFEFWNDRAGLEAAADLARALGPLADGDFAFALEHDAARVVARARKALPVIDAYRAEAGLLSKAQSPDNVRALPLDELDAEWARASALVWPLSGIRKKAVAARLDPSGTADPKRDLPQLRILQELLHRFDGAEPNAIAIPGWRGLETDVVPLRATLDAADALRAAIDRTAQTPDRRAALRAALLPLIADGATLGPTGTVGRAGAAFLEAHAAFDAALREFEAVAATATPLDASNLLAETVRIAEGVKAQAVHLNPWTAWRRECEAAQASGLRVVADAVASGAIGPRRAVEAFDAAYARWWAEQAIDAEPTIRAFTLAEHTDAVARFRELDDAIAELTRAYIRAKLSAEIPLKDAPQQPPGFGVLAHQLKLHKQRKPVRQLVAEMGPALTALTPCLLMSPLSVAQYLTPDAALFDLVIFDEASQITPWDAVGAIARGRQVIVAGDPKQMPPTSFFNRGAEAEGDDDTEIDQESILEECLGAGIPGRRLTWHYRSRDESLIAFSNRRYYGGDLITFPAPATRAAAVSLRRVAGAWERGHSRTNRGEAEAIVAETIARLTDLNFADESGAPPSIAVITFNAEQQKLIEDLLDQARRGRPELERFFAEDAAEPVVVKNLETVQGDERDLVLLGVGYGPETPNGDAMPMNFGPLNRQGGWRRLNVALTRARREMVVFASFPPDMIDLKRTNSDAVRDLKHFLEFAERGSRATGDASADAGRKRESAFEEAVAAGLRRHGWTVTPRIGVSRYRIDLGVVDYERPDGYLAGIVCDGVSYRDAATARDREKVREDVLTGLGWRLERVWSIDWWLDPEGALKRLHRRLLARLEEARNDRDAQDARRAARVSLNAVRADQPPAASEADDSVADLDASQDLGGEYRRTAFSQTAHRVDPDAFHLPSYTGVLRDMIRDVIETEAPICTDLLVERITRAHGFRRTGARIRDRVLVLARGIGHLEREPDGIEFFWRDGASVATWDRARYPATTEDIRSTEETALPELRAALRDCTSDDPIAEAARSFGVRRVSPRARERLLRAMPRAGHL